MKLDWKSIAVTTVIAILATVFLVPIFRPWLQRIPFIGNYAA